MTFVKEKKKNIVNLLLALLALPLIFAIISIIAVYNQTVNLKHGIVDMKTEIQKTETASAELKEKLFAIFDAQKVEMIVAERGLVKESNQHYLEVNTWVLASHF